MSIAASPLAELEIEAMIGVFLGLGSEAERIELLGPTFGWAFGMRGGLTIRDANGNERPAVAGRLRDHDKR